MKQQHVSRLAATLLAIGTSMSFTAPGALGQAPAALQGVWQSGDSSVRITVKGTEARAAFVQIGEGAKRLGFKPGELSFVATVNGTYLHGEQTIRYGAPCHPNGRKVPMMGRMTADGLVLAVHFYSLRVDQACRDTGQYTVTETLWKRTGR